MEYVKFVRIIFTLSPYKTIEPPSPTAREPVNLESVMFISSETMPTYNVPPFTAKEFSKVVLYIYPWSPSQSIAPP